MCARSSEGVGLMEHAPYSILTCWFHSFDVYANRIHVVVSRLPVVLRVKTDLWIAVKLGRLFA